jgi:hypothetical protein
VAEGLVTHRGSRGAWLQAPGARVQAKGESTLTVRGTTAALVWGHQDAIVLKAWAIYKVKGAWMLTARIDRVVEPYARYGPLLFTAPRPGGFWAWSVSALDRGDRQLRATLGPPER